MPRTITRTVYDFDELSDRAKERARDWYRTVSAGDFADLSAENVVEDFATCARILGIEMATHSVKLMNGTTRRDPDVYWSGFSTQGDGASYAGTYRYAKGAARAIRAYAPLDTELHRIAGELQRIQRRYFYSLVVSISAGTGNYSHSGAMSFETETDRGDVPWESDVDELEEALRDLANWLFRRLEKEYEYQLSDEQVDESIRANEYTFTEDGKREG